MRRIIASVALLAVLLLGAPGALAQTGDGSTTTTVPRGGDIIPEPNSGAEPEDAGDRGGALQTVLFVAIVGAVVVMGTIVVRQSRKVRADRGF